MQHNNRLHTSVYWEHVFNARTVLSTRGQKRPVQGCRCFSAGQWAALLFVTSFHEDGSGVVVIANPDVTEQAGV